MSTHLNIVTAFALASCVAARVGAQEPPKPETPAVKPETPAPKTVVPAMKPWDESQWTKVIQHRLYEKTGRHMLSVYGGVVPNDDLFWGIPVGMRYGYFFTETLAVEVNGAYQFTAGNGMKAALEPDTRRYFNPYQQLAWYANVGAAWFPIYGKMALLGANLTHFDIGIRGGIGAIGGKRTKFEGSLIKRKWVTDFCGTVGFDAITYLNRYLSLRAAVTIFMFDPEGKNVFLPTEISLGMTFFVPGLGTGE